jgi:hypothetical protein
MFQVMTSGGLELIGEQKNLGVTKDLSCEMQRGRKSIVESAWNADNRVTGPVCNQLLTSNEEVETDIASSICCMTRVRYRFAWMNSTAGVKYAFRISVGRVLCSGPCSTCARRPLRVASSKKAAPEPEEAAV